MISAFRSCMATLDVVTARKLWAEVAPHLDQPKTDHDMLVVLHMARTQSDAIRQEQRFYSHRWLTERGLPSQLPDHLRQSAERMYPVVKSAVGISVNFSSPEMKPAGDYIEGAICDVIENCYADGKEDPAYVKPRMDEAGQIARRRIFGAVGLHSLGSVGR